MSDLVALPVLLPLAVAAFALLFVRAPALQAALGLAGAVGEVAVSVVLFVETRAHGLLVAQIGGWPAPYGVAFVSDLFSAPLVLASSLLVLAVSIYARHGVDAPRRAFGFYPLVHVLLAGVCGAYLTADLFNLFVWVEVLLMSSFVLLALGGTRAQLEGAIKYVTLNLLASAFLLSGVGLLYGMTGTLSYADMALRLAGTDPEGPIVAAALILFTAFGIKAATFPFFFWLPASYHTPPAAVTALFSGLLTKVGVYAMIRVFTLVLGPELDVVTALLAPVAGATMVVGVLGAAAQVEIRRILAFHIVSQIGYMVMGLAISGTLGIAGALYFLLHNVAAKSALFLAAGVIEHERGTGRLEGLGGLARERPLLGVLFLVPALSLAGLPPLSGFVGKLLLVRAGLEAGAWALTAAALAVSLLTLYSMGKIWLQAFWAPAPAGLERGPRASRGMVASLAAVGLVTVLLGVLAEPVVRLTMDAADQVLDREAYARAVLAAGREVAPERAPDRAPERAAEALP